MVVVADGENGKNGKNGENGKNRKTTGRTTDEAAHVLHTATVGSRDVLLYTWLAAIPLIIMIIWRYSIGPSFARLDVTPSQQPVFKLRFLRLHLPPACFHRPFYRATCILNRLYSH